MTDDPEVLIDGHPPTLAALARFAVVNDGHFTAMQVRRGAVRGLGLHLERLHAAHRALYGTALDVDGLRRLLRAVIAVHPDASLRVTVAEPDPGHPAVLTAVRPPIEPESNPRPMRLTVVEWVRGVPGIKHVGTFPQIQYARQARAAGFDDAVLVDAAGGIAEATTANIAFARGDGIVWPAGPALPGITWRLLDRALPAAGIPSRTRPIGLRHLTGFDGAVLVNSVGIVPVAAIAGHEFPRSAEVARHLDAVYRAVPAEAV